MARNFQFRMSHLLTAVAFACLLAFAASFFEWTAQTWLRNCFVLALVACGAVLAVGCTYVLLCGILRRRKRCLPDPAAPRADGRAEPTERPIRYSKPEKRQASAYKWSA